MNKPERWKALGRIIIIAVALIAIFGWFDSLQIQTIYGIDQANKWDLYNMYQEKAIVIQWYFVLLAFAFIYYAFTKDQSEAIAVFAVPAILMAFGLEDAFFFVFSPVGMTSCMQWFNDLHAPCSYVSTWILHETCTSPRALFLSILIGVGIAYFVYRWLKRQTW